MKAIFEQLQSNPSEAIIVRYIKMPSFDAPFHFHPEYELTLIVKGKGQRFVGKQVESFENGDLVLLGPNLPHCWINHPKADDSLSEAIVVQFNQEFLGKEFFELSAFKTLKLLLDKSRSGIEVQEGMIKKQISQQMNEMILATPVRKILILLEILETLSHAIQVKLMDISFASNPLKFSETSRFQKVFSYIIDHYKDDISLEKIAAVADLSPTSFCRYFKSITQQSFVELLLEFRIKQSCHLLISSDLPIREIAFQSGFDDIPYFNRVFKKKKGMNPNKYRYLSESH